MRKIALFLITALIITLIGCDAFTTSGQLSTTTNLPTTSQPQSTLTATTTAPSGTASLTSTVFTTTTMMTTPVADTTTVDLTTLSVPTTTNSTTLPITTTPTSESTTLVTTSATTTSTGSLQVSLSANIDGVTIGVSRAEPYLVGDFVTFTAEPPSGYVFLHWQDLDQELIVSVNSELSMTLGWNIRLEAVFIPDSSIRLTIDSNSESATGTIGQSGEYEIGMEVTIYADEIANQRFLHWLDAKTDTLVSTADPFVFTATESMYLIAVYEAMQESMTTYATDFELAVKGIYEIGTIVVDDEPWVFADALVGSHANDQKFGGKSVRIRNGYIQTEFPMTNLAAISFYHGRYLSDPASNITVAVSRDKALWTAIATMPSGDLQEFTFDFDEAWYRESGYSLEDELYVRIASPNASRVNIDNLAFKRYQYVTRELPVIFADTSSVTFPNNSTRVELGFSPDHQIVYSLGDSWDSTACNAVDDLLGSLSCSVYGDVDTTVTGLYDVVYYVIDSDGEYASATITYAVLKDASLLEIDYPAYYDTIEGLYGEALLLALRAIIQTGATLQTYDDARVILADADVDPEDENSVLTIYSQTSVPRVWDAESWHREHVWPNSRLGVPRVSGSDRSIASDLHNLRAIVPSINSSRSNKIFAAMTTSDTYDPGEDRGDVARILFYMLIMYPELSMTDTILPNDPATNYTPAGAKMALWSLMFLWNEEDPVSQFEENRNEVIYSYQNNRNPFIDYPYLAELIWFADQAFGNP